MVRALWSAAARGLSRVLPVMGPVTLALVVAVGAAVQVYRIGDSGAKAAWQGRFSTSRSGAGR
ncbi:hypothetical protein [Streptomyces sp. NPDC050388]|uniref:hypothetical protein n=1 Tax=Streptomyces sp. NPDC050388 TaxID=3155781 RepID=UPI003430CACD